MSKRNFDAPGFSGPDGDWNHDFQTVGDARIHFVREGQGAPVFLLHGWPEFWWTWHRVIPGLSQDFDIVAPDLRGFGDSSKPGKGGNTPPTAEIHAADIIGLADALGIDRFAVVSHDVGAYVAQQIARSYPDRLTRLFFFNAPYPGIGRRWVDAGHVQEIWYQSFNQLAWAPELIGHNRETCRIYFENMIAHWSHANGAFDGQIDHWVDNFMKPGNLEGGFAWYAASHPARVALIRDGAPALPKIETPSRFFWGRHDPIIPSAWTDRLPDYFVDPVVEFAEDAGHFVQMEMPESTCRNIRAHFSGL
ncbi:alpha/beta hydrolase [Hwanghaeella grinnelliae]|uniref:Alpha/beta hydrolase n=1 Tax=Hwanghaeella grinnelliae TaxID=2500179 RepID=A0A437QH88_9PROT|nr:alpha/beta hydrolase [Hwanghaeella grinnelliae]RVU33911.1 alpha/beta hydrolase [Hwanghaeella grinnelliae]